MCVMAPTTKDVVLVPAPLMSVKGVYLVKSTSVLVTVVVLVLFVLPFSTKSTVSAVIVVLIEFRCHVMEGTAATSR